MCICDRTDDGEAEADTFAPGPAVRVESMEGLEQAPDLAARDRGAAVRHRENGSSRRGVGCDLDPAAGDVVPDRVRHQVGDETLDQVVVAGSLRRLEDEDAVELAQIVGSQRLRRDRREVDRLALLRTASAPRKRQTRFEKPLLSAAGREDVFGDQSPPGHVHARVDEGQLEQGTLGCKRRAQLVRDICGKGLLDGLGYE